MKRVNEEVVIDSFQIDALPVEVIIHIVYNELDLVKAIFQLNTTMHKIQETRGFWSTLYKVGYPDRAFTLCGFLQESPKLTQLNQEAMIDILLLTQIFDSFEIAKKFRVDRNEYEVRPLPQIESEILQGDFEYFEVLYEVNMDPDGTLHAINSGFYPFTCLNYPLMPFVIRLCLIDFYLLLQESQIADALEKTLAFVESIKENRRNDYFLQPDDVRQLIERWVKELEKEKVRRLLQCAAKMKLLSIEFKRRIDAIVVLDPHNGKPITAVTAYFKTLDSDFSDYFGLDDKEATRHWKKIYMQTRKCSNEYEPFFIYSVDEQSLPVSQ